MGSIGSGSLCYICNTHYLVTKVIRRGNLVAGLHYLSFLRHLRVMRSLHSHTQQEICPLLPHLTSSFFLFLKSLPLCLYRTMLYQHFSLRTIELNYSQSQQQFGSKAFHKLEHASLYIQVVGVDTYRLNQS